MNFKGFYINLDHSHERRLFMEKQLRGLGLTQIIQRLSAIVPKQRDAKHLTGGELGCFLSHQSFLEQIGGEVGLVLEDDAVLPAGFGENLTKLVDSIKNKEWDMVFLGTSFNYADLGRLVAMFRFSQTLGDISDARFTNYQLIPANPWYVYGTFGYIVNPSSIDKFRELFEHEKSLDYPRQIDTIFLNSIRAGQLNAFLVFPFMVGVNANFKSELSKRPNEKEHRRKAKALNVFVAGLRNDEILLESYGNLSRDFNKNAFILSQLIYEFIIQIDNT